MPGRLSGKVAVITGCGSGIGQAIAERFAREGASIVVDYRGHSDTSKETVEKVEAAGARSILVEADVTRLTDTQHLVDEAYAQLGGCDILVNNAGIELRANFWDVTEQDFDAVMNVNFRGAFFLTQFFVRKLREAGKPGCIINISSVHEDMVFPHFTSYAASKGALRMVMRNLSVELGPLGITVNNIAPGAIQTPINSSLLENPEQMAALIRNIPLGRMGRAEEVAGVAAFLASAEGTYVTGSTYVIDGGLMRNYHEQ